MEQGKNTTKLRERQFSTTSWVVVGTERTMEVGETNVVQYTFVNVGTTVVNIDGLILYPSFCGFGPTSFTTNHNMAENDVSVYKYRFDGLPKNVVAKVPLAGVGQPSFYPIPLALDPTKFAGIIIQNGLQIIAKVRANRRKK